MGHPDPHYKVRHEHVVDSITINVSRTLVRLFLYDEHRWLQLHVLQGFLPPQKVGQSHLEHLLQHVRSQALIMLLIALLVQQNVYL